MDQPRRFPRGPSDLHPAVRAPQFPFHGGGFHPDGLTRHPVDASPFYRPVHGVSPFLERPRMPSPSFPHHQPVMAPGNMEYWNGHYIAEREQFRHPFPAAAHRLPEDALYMQNLPKRMRVGDEIPAYSAGHHQSDSFSMRTSFEDARRLNLIRDHGRNLLNAPSIVVDHGLPGAETERIGPNGSVRNNLSLSGHKIHSGENLYGFHKESTVNSNFRDSDRFIHSEVNEFQRRDRGDSTSSRYGSHSNEDSAVNSQQLRPQPSSFVTPQGSKGILGHRQQVHQAPSRESQYPQANIYPNPSLSILGRYNPSEHDVHRHPEGMNDAYANELGNAQQFEHKTSSQENSFKPLELSDHRFTSKNDVPANQIHRFPVQYGTNITLPSQNSLTPQHLPGHPPEPSMSGSFTPLTLSHQRLLGSEAVPHKHALKDKRTLIDASLIFRKPHRSSRPEHIVVILRGLPGSGKSYLAKVLRDLEVDNGGTAPRIHCIDDYFMSEVETDEDIDVLKSSGSVKGTKQVSGKFEYCFEPEMEEAYRSSMLKAFKKTVEDRIFSFAIVDDRNLRVADFAQFWSIGKRSGYEVYIVEAPYKDPAGCAARNIHNFTIEDIREMAKRWEEAPPFYLQLDIQSLIRGDDLGGSNIEEVDMDMEDTPHDVRVTLETLDEEPSTSGDQALTDDARDEESLSTGERWELKKSKWSEDLDEEDLDKKKKKTFSVVPRPDSLSGLIKAYGKREKSVRWGDQSEKRGFSIGANRPTSALIIGPGPGYNLGSNPPAGGEAEGRNEGNSAKKKSSLFLDHTRAERESFRAVFDRRRRHRIGGLNDPEDD